jgi:phosphoribosylglycinamide formyltransferase-1
MPAPQPVRIAVFASGTGSNFKAIHAHLQTQGRQSIAIINLCVSHNPNAPALDYARSNDIRTLVVDKMIFHSKESIVPQLKENQVDLVVCAGFMWLIPEILVHAFDDRIINVHPALLPQFGGKGMYGMHVHEAVKNAGVLHTGITIHKVNARYDEGDILFQASCQLNEADSVQEIAHKVHALEHIYYPLVVEDMARKLQN